MLVILYDFCFLEQRTETMEILIMEMDEVGTSQFLFDLL